MKTLLSKGRKTATVDIDGDSITIRELSLADANNLKATPDQSEIDTTIKLIVASIVEDIGNGNWQKIYTDADIPALLAGLSLGVTKLLGEAIGLLNGFSGAKNPNA